MKVHKSILILLFLVCSLISLNAQNNYVVTNNTTDWYTVLIRIGDSPVQCSTSPSSTRTDINTVSPVGCGKEQVTFQLSPDEWVYQVEIYESSSCPTTCTHPTGTTMIVGLLKPCVSNPDSDNWNSCSADSAQADRTSYCNIDH